MFTGIIESIGKITKITPINTNIELTLECEFTHELKVDQSMAHNGCCLTVTSINGKEYTVVAIAESLKKTNLGDIKLNDLINLERCLKLNDRLDGHMVQGHVDQLGEIVEITNHNGSYNLHVQYDETDFTTVNKGSICLNGMSLTVFDSRKGAFTVSIIPYTWEFTNTHTYRVGDRVNLEFDIIGKYLAKFYQSQVL